MPGSTVRERYDNARRYGFEALELSQPPVAEHAREAIRGRMAVSAIAGGYRGWLIDPDPERARAAREDLRLLLELGAELDAGCIVVPIWGRTRHLPGIATGREPEEDESLFLEGLGELAAHARRCDGTILLEPINRYQNDVCVTIDDALRLRARTSDDRVKVAADSFHMNIEEADLGASIERAGAALGYVQLADNQRLEPGQGHIPFAPLFAALARIAYEGYCSIECARLSGPAEEALPRAVGFLRSQMATA